MILDPIKHVLRVFLNGFKNILQKACDLGRSEQRFKLCGGEDISIQEEQAMPYQYSLYKEY